MVQLRQQFIPCSKSRFSGKQIRDCCLQANFDWIHRRFAAIIHTFYAE